MNRLANVLKVVPSIGLFMVLAVGAWAGEMQEKAGMMNEPGMDKMPEKSGSMMHDEGMEKMGGTMKEHMEEMMPAARTGMLSGSKGHSATGRVLLTSGEMGPILVLKEIKVDKVPDGRVYLARDADYRNGVELGRLQQFEGTVTFPVPKDVDTGAFDSVVIWCKKFDVEIGRAHLAADKM